MRGCIGGRDREKEEGAREAAGRGRSKSLLAMARRSSYYLR